MLAIEATASLGSDVSQARLARVFTEHHALVTPLVAELRGASR